jgi:hypothetical protein
VPWAAAAAVAGAYISSEGQKSAANKAANAQQSAAQAAIDQTNLNYDRTATNLNPYINAGSGALGQMNALNSGDFSSFRASPDYQYTMSQALQGVDKSAASRGALYNGGTSVDLLNAASGIASQQYNSYYNKLAGLAQTGYGAASNLGSIGANAAGQIGAQLTNSGNAQAQGYINSANANSNFYGQAANALGTAYGNYQNGTSSYGSTGSGQPYTGYGAIGSAG